MEIETIECGHCGGDNLRHYDDDVIECQDCEHVIECHTCGDTGEVPAAFAPGGKGICFDCGDLPDNYGETMHRLAHPVNRPW